MTSGLCEIAAERGHPEVYLYVLEGPLVPFYRRRGWSPIETIGIATRTFAVMKKVL